jgi:hypothetical protein
MLRRIYLFEIQEEPLNVTLPSRALLMVGAYCAFWRARQLPAEGVLPYNENGLFRQDDPVMAVRW